MVGSTAARAGACWAAPKSAEALSVQIPVPRRGPHVPPGASEPEHFPIVLEGLAVPCAVRLGQEVAGHSPRLSAATPRLAPMPSACR